MRKILSIVLCAVAVSVFGDTETQLGDEIGVTKVISKLANTVVAISYDDLAGGQGMVYSNLVKTTNLSIGDRLIEFRDGKYISWVLAGEGNVKYWQKQQGVLKDSAGKDITLDIPPADAVRGAVGTGIWLVRQNPTDDKGDAVPFYIYGKTVSSPTSAVTGATWTLVGNPKQEAVDLNPAGKVEGAQTGDQIVVVGEDGYPIYYMFKSGKGWQASVGGKVVLLPSIGAGLGLWILTAENAIIHW